MCLFLHFELNCARYGPFLNEHQELITDNYTMSEMLRKQYEKSFSQPFENAIVDDPEIFFSSSDDQSVPRFDNLVITHADVEDAIDSLSANASPGPDYFPAVLLKHGKFSLSHALADIFSSSLQNGEVPREFKMAFITRDGFNNVGALGTGSSGGPFFSSVVKKIISV